MNTSIFFAKLHEIINDLIKSIVHYHFCSLNKNCEKLNEFKYRRIMLYIVAKCNTIKYMSFVDMKLINLFKLKYEYRKNKKVILLKLIIVI